MKLKTLAPLIWFACFALVLTGCEPGSLPTEVPADPVLPQVTQTLSQPTIPPTTAPPTQSPTAVPTQASTAAPTNTPVPAPTEAQLPALEESTLFSLDYSDEGLDILRAALLPDNRHLWVRPIESGRIDIWNIETGEQRIFELQDGIPQFAIAAQEEDIVVATYNPNINGDVALWRLSAGKSPAQPMLVGAFSDPDWLVTYSEISPDGTTLAVGYSNGEIRLIDTTSGQNARTIEAHIDWVVRLVFSPDSRYLLSDSLSFDPNTLIFDVRSGALIATLDRENYDPSFVGTFSPDGSMVAISTFFGVGIFETGNWAQVSKVDEFIEAYAFTPEGHELLAAFDNSTVAFSILTGEVTNEYEGIDRIFPQANGRMIGLDINADHTGLTLLELAPATQVESSSDTDPDTGDTVLIEPYCSRENPDPIFINSNQPVTLTWRWEAATAELVQEHLDKAIYDIRIDGQPVIPLDVSEITYVESGDFYRITWATELGMLVPGAHRAERRLNWTAKVSDGWTTFGPETEVEMLWDDCDIVVAALSGPEPNSDPACKLEPGQEIHTNKTTNLWVQPDVIAGSISREVDPKIALYVLGPPQWGPIHRETETGGWWVPVSADPSGSNPAYLWELRVQECFE
jgi:hypothetical protein